MEDYPSEGNDLLPLLEMLNWIPGTEGWQPFRVEGDVTLVRFGVNSVHDGTWGT